MDKHYNLALHSFKDMVLSEESFTRESKLATDLREMIRHSALGLDVTQAVHLLHESANMEIFEVGSLPNLYPWFSSTLFLEAYVGGSKLPSSFLRKDGSIDLIQDMQLNYIGFVVEPMAPPSQDNNLFSFSSDQIAACLQIAPFMGPFTGAVIGPQFFWTLAIGYDGRIVQTDERSAIQFSPVAIEGFQSPDQSAIDEMAQVSVPLLSAALFSVLCISAIHTGYTVLQRNSITQGDSHTEQPYVLNVDDLQNALNSELSKHDTTFGEAVMRCADCFPKGVPSN